MYMRNTINANLRSDLTYDNLEALYIDIYKPNSKLFIILVCYRPPRADDTLNHWKN